MRHYKVFNPKGPPSFEISKNATINILLFKSEKSEKIHHIHDQLKSKENGPVSIWPKQNKSFFDNLDNKKRTSRSFSILFSVMGSLEIAL